MNASGVTEEVKSATREVIQFLSDIGLHEAAFRVDWEFAKRHGLSPVVLEEYPTATYEVLAGNGLRVIARGKTREEAESILTAFESRMIRAGVDVPRGRVQEEQ